MKAYLSGPMTGYAKFNFPMFEEATRYLRNQGWEIVSPAEMDIEAGLDPDSSLPFTVKQYRDALARDLRAVMDCDSLILLMGWERSSGAQAELALAKQLGHEIFLYTPNHTAVPFDELSDEITDESGPSRRIGDLLFDEATTYVEGPTGGRKGQKVCRYDLIPPEALAELAAAYGEGAKKYDDDNYLKGYNWRSSFGAMLRHTYRWFCGQSFDPETGIHHLALASWHCFTMMTFEARKIGQDDRPKIN